MNPTINPNLLAFDNPWEVVGLVVVIVLVRLAIPYLQPLRSQRASILEFIDSLLVAALVVFCMLRPFVVQAFFIPSGSMENTLQVGDKILVNKFIYFFREPQVGDVVVFDAPKQASKDQKDFIKRVVGLPGDLIAVHDQRLYRNGRPIDEPYVKDSIMYQWPESDTAPPQTLGSFPFDAEGQAVLKPGGEPIKVLQDGAIRVPKGYLLVMGDNRNDSNDCHRWNAPDAQAVDRPAPFLPRENVLGKAFCIFWPPSRLGLIQAYHPGAASAPGSTLTPHASPG